MKMIKMDKRLIITAIKALNLIIKRIDTIRHRNSYIYHPIYIRQMYGGSATATNHQQHTCVCKRVEKRKSHS